jgi:hypothetical protein
MGLYPDNVTEIHYTISGRKFARGMLEFDIEIRTQFQFPGIKAQAMHLALGKVKILSLEPG